MKNSSIYTPHLAYDPYEFALKQENERLTEENYKLKEELQYYKNRIPTDVNYLSINAPITISIPEPDLPMYRVAAASSKFEPEKYSYHIIGRWEGGPTVQDNFGYSYYISKQMLYETVDKARLVQMLMEKTAYNLARRI